MLIKNHSALVRAAALLLVVVLVFPVGVSAATVETAQPRASDYLDSYNAYIYTAGGGKIQICFSVFGTNYMDTLGALTIQVYESVDNNTWTWVKSYSDGNYPNMIGYDDAYHSGVLDYYGIAGRYYKAYVCIWAGKDGGGDTRYFWTSVKKAT